MKRYPAITKKEFRELCELSSGPIEVGSALVARAEAEFFDRIVKSEQDDSVSADNEKVVLVTPTLVKIRLQNPSSKGIRVKGWSTSAQNRGRIKHSPKKRSVKETSHKKVHRGRGIRANKTSSV
jgi:hypothetical protein